MGRTLEQILAGESREFVESAKEKADKMLLGIRLAELREGMNLTQLDMANALGVKQPTVSDMEKRGRDLKLSTLKRYIEAGGGKLKISCDLPNGVHYDLCL